MRRNIVACAQEVGAARQRGAAVLQHDGPMRVTEGERNALLGEQQGQAFPLIEIDQDAVDVRGDFRCESP